MGKLSLPVFGVAGTHVMRFLKGLAEEGLSHLYHPSSTEIAGGFAAVGYSRTSGKPSLCLLTPGPGFLMGAAAIHEARMKGTPVIFLVGQVASSQLREWGKALHELPDQEEMGKLLAAKLIRVDSAEEANRALLEALVHCGTIPPSPAVVEITVDALKPHEFTQPTYASKGDSSTPPTPGVGELEKALRLVEEAKAPIIYAGYGCLTPPAGKLLEVLSAKLEAPVFTSISGKGAIPDTINGAAGVITPKVLREVAPKSDLMIALGTVLSHTSTFNRTAPLPARCLLISLEDRTPSYTGVDVTHLRMPVLSFLEAAAKVNASRGSGLVEEAAKARRKLMEEAEASFPAEMGFLRAIIESVPQGTPVFTDPTIISYWGRYFFPVAEPGTYHYPWGSNSLGYAVPAAAGASAANPVKRKLVITGDGNIPYCAMELALIRNKNLPITILVFSDRGYGVLRKWRGWKSTPPIGVDLPEMPLSHICEGIGMDYNRCDSPSGLGEALKKFFNGGTGPNLIEVTADLTPPWSIL